MKVLWQRASSQSPCGVRMLIECNHRNPRGLAPGSSQYKAFFNYNGINLLPVVDGAHMMGNIMMTVSNTIPACTTAINRYIDFSGRNVKLTNPGIVSNIYPAHMPKRIYVDNERIISPDEIYTAGNTSIENIDINPKNKYYTSIDGIVYTADKKTLIRCPVGKSGKVVIPDGVTTIGRHAFRSCKISEVVIPDSVTEIGISAFTESHIQDFTLGKGMTYIGKYMFSTCKNIKHIHIPSHIKEIMSSAFSACRRRLLVKIQKYIYGRFTSPCLDGIPVKIFHQIIFWHINFKYKEREEKICKKI